MVVVAAAVCAGAPNMGDAGSVPKGEALGVAALDAAPNGEVPKSDGVDAAALDAAPNSEAPGVPNAVPIDGAPKPDWLAAANPKPAEVAGCEAPKPNEKAIFVVAQAESSLGL